MTRRPRIRFFANAAAVMVAILPFFCQNPVCLAQSPPSRDIAAETIPPYLNLAARRKLAKIRAVDFDRWSTNPSGQSTGHAEPMIAVAVGDLGRIIRTVDGGQNWQSVASPTAAMLVDVAFIDSNRVVAVGSVCQAITGLRRAVVLSSTDGGRHFDIQPDHDMPGIDRVTAAIKTSSHQPSAGRPIARISGDWSYHLAGDTFDSDDAGRTWTATPPQHAVGTGRDTASNPADPLTGAINATGATNAIETALLHSIANINSNPNINANRLVISASDIDRVPWSDAAIAALVWNYRVTVQIIRSDPFERAAPLSNAVLAKWRQAAAMVGVEDVLVFESHWNHWQPSDHTAHWIERSLVNGQVGSAAKARLYWAAGSMGDRETLVPQLGVLKSDFAEDVLRYVSPMQSPVIQFITDDSKPLIDSVRGQNASRQSASRYQMQLASARLPRRARVSELLNQAVDPATTESSLWSEAITSLVQRTTAWDRQRLAWAMIRQTRELDESASRRQQRSGVSAAMASVLESLVDAEIDSTVRRYIALMATTARHSRECRHLANMTLPRDVTSDNERSSASGRGVALSPFESSSISPDQSVAPTGYLLAGSATIPIGVPMAGYSPSPASPGGNLQSHSGGNSGGAFDSPAAAPGVELWWEFSPAMLLSNSLSRTTPQNALIPAETGDIEAASVNRSASRSIDPNDPRLDPLRRADHGVWSSILDARPRPVTRAKSRPHLDGRFDDWPEHLRPHADQPLVAMCDETYLYIGAITPVHFDPPDDSHATPDRHHRRGDDERLARDGLAANLPTWRLAIDTDGDLQSAFELLVAADRSHGDRVDHQWQWQPRWYFATGIAGGHKDGVYKDGDHGAGDHKFGNHGAAAGQTRRGQAADSTIEIALRLADIDAADLSRVHLSATSFSSPPARLPIDHPDPSNWLALALAGDKDEAATPVVAPGRSAK